MKKSLWVTLFIIVILVMCIGCDKYSGERPTDYPTARWKAEMPDIWFDVVQPTKTLDCMGQLVLENNVIEIIASFDAEGQIYIASVDNIGYFVGKCKFGPEELLVRVDTESDTLLDGNYETIVFSRIPKDSTVVD